MWTVEEAVGLGMSSLSDVTENLIELRTKETAQTRLGMADLELGGIVKSYSR